MCTDLKKSARPIYQSKEAMATHLVRLWRTRNSCPSVSRRGGGPFGCLKHVVSIAQPYRNGKGNPWSWAVRSLAPVIHVRGVLLLLTSPGPRRWPGFLCRHYEMSAGGRRRKGFHGLLVELKDLPR